MLTLSDSVRMGRFTIFRDVAFESVGRTLTSSFYALPDAPRLAVESDGGPAFRFWWYRRALIGGAATTNDAVRAGGLLMVTVDLGATSDERVQLKQDLAARFSIAGGADAVNLLPMPFSSGTVALAVAAEGAAADFVSGIAGNGPARLTGNEQATFAVNLTRDGAALVAAAIDGNQAVLHVRYDLTFEYHLDDVKLRVWCDARKAQAAFSAPIAGVVDIQALRGSLVASQAAGIEIGSESPLPADRQTALLQFGQSLLDRALGAAFLTDDGKGVRAYDTSMDATLNHTFTSSVAASEHAVAEAILLLPVTPSTRGSRVTVIDLATEPQPIDVRVLCPIDFVNGPIAFVHLFIAYDDVAANGTAIHQAADAVFKTQADSFDFHSLAGPNTRQYRWHADVGYRDGSTTSLPETTDDESLLILAIDGLGVLDVAVSLGDVPFETVAHVVVDLEYPPRPLTYQLVLDGGHPQDTWQAVVGPVDTRALRWRASFICVDGRRVAGDWQSAASSRIFVDAPRSLAPSTTTVQVISAGDFTGLAQLLIELSAGGGATTTLSFTASGQSAQWTPPISAGAPLAYQARITAIGQDGTSTVTDWVDKDSAILVVSDQSRFVVQVVPTLLDIGGTWSAAAVSFEHIDPSSGADDRDTLVLRDRSDGTWSFRMGSSGQHSYRYQLTLVPKSGSERLVGPWQQTDDKVLILRLPSK